MNPWNDTTKEKESYLKANLEKEVYQLKLQTINQVVEIKAFKTKLSSPQKHHSKSFEEANSILKREIKPNLKNFCSRKVTTPVK